MDKRVVKPLDEQMHGMGLTDFTPGGAKRHDDMLRMFGLPIQPMDGSLQEGQDAPTGETAQSGESTTIQEEADLYDGPTVTVELLERLESMIDMVQTRPMQEAEEDDAALQEYLSLLVDKFMEKEVPPELEERTIAVVRALEEMKKKRIVAGKITRVNVLRGSKAMKSRRKKRLEYKKHKAKIRIKVAKRERKAGARIKAAKTARKHQSVDKPKPMKSLASVVKRVKGKSGLQRKNTHESVLVNELYQMLQEETQSGSTLRDEIMVRLGDIALYLENILEEDVGEVLEEQYASLAYEYCAGSLTEGKLDEAAFMAQVSPFVRVIGRCVKEIEEAEKNA